MRLLTLSLLASLAAATPITVTSSIFTTHKNENELLEPRFGFGFGRPGSSSSSSGSNSITTSNDLTNGEPEKCPNVIFIFARATLEPGNMGVSLGPLLSTSLSHIYPSLWTQGVGVPYNADFASNSLPGGASREAIQEAARIFNMAGSKCPSSKIVVGGYSQGSAVIAGAISTCSAKLRESIAGVVLFGYTQNLQNHGSIPGFPPDKTSVFCATGDLVCSGSLILTPMHFSYAGDAAGAATEFLIGKLAGVRGNIEA